MHARYGLRMTPLDILNIGKQTLRDQLAFNEKAGFGNYDPEAMPFIHEEAISPTGQVFDVDAGEIKKVHPANAGVCSWMKNNRNLK